MRLWTLHPRYLDAKGLVAAWREALLAQKVLSELTTGYRHHPQLIRFRLHPQPLQAMGVFLAGLAEEAEQQRGYHFDTTRILQPETVNQIEESLLCRSGNRVVRLPPRDLPEMPPLLEVAEDANGTG